MPCVNKRKFGSEGEVIAENYLKANHYCILEKNFRVGRIGEVDIIAREKEFVCFIEVKARTGTEFGMPSEAVNFRKQQKIKQLAYFYTAKHKLFNCNFRFDIVEIIFDKNKQYRINLIKDAF